MLIRYFIQFSFFSFSSSFRPNIYHQPFSVSLQAFHLEDIMKPGSLICFKNLVFKTDSFPASLVTATCTDLSAAYSNPKELFLKEAASELQNKIGVSKLHILWQAKRLMNFIRECLSARCEERTSEVELTYNSKIRICKEFADVTVMHIEHFLLPCFLFNDSGLMCAWRIL